MQSAKVFNPKEIIPTTANIHSIACLKSFNQLEHREKMYAYHFARAAWQGSRICWFQRSAESPALLVMLYNLWSKGIEEVRKQNAELSDDQMSMLYAYSAAVFQNCGNFKSFGDTKFVPALEPTLFRGLVEKSAPEMIEIW